MYESPEPLTVFFSEMLPAAHRAGYKVVVTLLAREADSETIFADIDRYWSSLHDLTGPHLLFVLGAKNAGKKFPHTGLPEWREPVLHCSPNAAISGGRTIYWQGVTNRGYMARRWDDNRRFSQTMLREGHEDPSEKLARSHTTEITSLRHFFGLAEESIPALLFIALGEDGASFPHPIVVPLSAIYPATIYGYLKRVIGMLEPLFAEAESLSTSLKDLESKLRVLDKRRHKRLQPVRLSLPEIESEVIALCEAQLNSAVSAQSVKTILAICKSSPKAPEDKRRCFDALSTIRTDIGSHSQLIIHLQGYIDRSFITEQSRPPVRMPTTEDVLTGIDNARHRLRNISKDIERALVPATKPEKSQPESQWDFFVAYSSKDNWYAERLFPELSKLGSVFVDRFSLQPGDIWPKRLRQEQDKSRSTVLLITSNTDDAWFAKSECIHAIELARRSQHRIIPVLIGRDIKLPYGLEQVHSIQSDTAIRFEELARNIANGLRVAG